MGLTNCRKINKGNNAVARSYEYGDRLRDDIGTYTHNHSLTHTYTHSTT